MNAKFKYKNNKGLTLIEVLVASIVLIVCMVGIMDSFAAGAQLKTKSENATTALFLAQDMLETTLNLPLFTEEFEEGGIEEYSGVFGEFYSSYIDDAGSYKYNVRIKAISDVLKEVTVTVTAPPAKLGYTVELSALTTLIGK